jgi:hypothetical protein
MTTSTNMLTVTLDVEPSQADMDAAMDWIAAHAVPGAEGTFVDLGTVHVWLFPAVA